MPETPVSDQSRREFAARIGELESALDRMQSAALTAQAERDRLAEQVQRIRALDLHQGSVHFPDECRQGCPGCAIAAALDGTEADRD